MCLKEKRLKGDKRKMINENKKRICKKEGCKKELPVGYKYDKCESCRNKFIEGGKSIFKIGVSAVAAVGVFILYKK